MSFCCENLTRGGASGMENVKGVADDLGNFLNSLTDMFKNVFGNNTETTITPFAEQRGDTTIYNNFGGSKTVNGKLIE